MTTTYQPQDRTPYAGTETQTSQKTWAVGVDPNFSSVYLREHDSPRDPADKIDELKRLVKKSGVFYLDRKNKLLCVVGNLEAYRIELDAVSQTIILAGNAQRDHWRGLQLKLQRVNISGVGKSCNSGISIDDLVQSS